MKKLHVFLLVYSIVLLAGFLRLYNVNWDSGYHMHPDERAIVLSVIELVPPATLSEFLSPDSPWNPKFFAYGSFPFYLLYVVGNLAGIIDPVFAQYDGINIVGRYLSALFDLGTLLFVFLIARRLMQIRFAILAAFFYGISVLPIQLSHFYAVDTLLTFFITGTLYFLLSYYTHPKRKYAVLIGIFFGLALATKISSSLLLVSIGIVLIVDYLLLLFKHPRNASVWLPLLPRFVARLIPQAFLLGFTALMTFLLFEPYALLDFPTFLRQTLEQSQMTKSAFTFPYTLQYVGKIPYLYELKNTVLYGLGPLLAVLSLSGIVLLTFHAVTKEKKDKWAKELILVVYFWTYFLIVGSFAIGFMRYMLPIYPLMAVGAAYFLFQGVTLFPVLRKKPVANILLGVLIVSLLIWPLSFLQIYAQPNTRILATNYIHTAVPAGKTIAIEHWDDALPLTGQMKYRMITLNLYDPDTPAKWEVLRQQLQETDYIILASNRLYDPLMRLTDCERLPVDRCYPETAAYYHKLFDGTLGFKKVADITSYPTIPFTSIQINDQRADESFTVYDHPRVMIFKKIEL